MRSSLSDRADLRRLRPLAAGGPPAAIAACLVDGGAVQLDEEDPQWPDRDRVVADVAVADVLTTRLAERGVSGAVVRADTPGEALGAAVGAALLSVRQGAAWRVWCVVGVEAEDDGVVWEAARAARAAWPLPLVVLVAGAPGRLWDGAGWGVEVAVAADPVHILAALDRATASTTRPVAVAVAP